MQIQKSNGKLVQFFFASLIGIFLAACGGSSDSQSHANHSGAADKVESKTANAISADPMVSKGVGPVTEIHLAALDSEMAKEGQSIFENSCSACHKISERYIGPAVAGITSRRTPEWIMNMILNPEEMVKVDPTAKALLAEYIAPMANQNLSQDQARKILEYFRTLD